ncbi:MAG: HAMP domain-containing histidine kinase [Anaerolineaceae bacterium]|nr:HAMP domain-containing histidine kinase [Anaerolineaceae bacterium]
MKLLRWLLALLPLGITIPVALVLQLLAPDLPRVVVRADPGTWLILLGGVATLFLLARAWLRRSSEKQCLEVINAERQQSEEARRRFYRRLDHELKNPLTAMRAALVNLSESSGSMASQAAFSDVEHQAERLSRLVADLRKLAELEVRPLEEYPVDIRDLLEETIDAACLQPGRAGRSVNLIAAQVPWPLPPVTGDRDLLGLAFYNLLENALKFTGPADTVEIRAAEDGRNLTIEVADTGPGISPDDLPRVFEELYRGANARGVEGSGLGLSLVQRIIARHGGELMVRSRQDQRHGTVFTVRLRVARDAGITKPTVTKR